MFQSVYQQYSWNQIGDQIADIKEHHVENLLLKINQRILKNDFSNRLLSPFDFLVLISPQAKPFLENLATLSYQLTRKRFGNTIQLYAPVYLTNSCTNICTYCGFSYDNKMERIILNLEEIEKEIAVLKKNGFDHILVVTGEDHLKAGVDYLAKSLPIFRKHFSHVSIEVQPLDLEEYLELIKLGLDSVMVYQETYHRENYKIYHPKGKKSNFNYRLATPDRLGQAKIHKMGLGVLLGLEDWRIDSFFCALHLDYLRKNYWSTKYSVSFPRLRPAQGVEISSLEKKYLSDEDMAQLIFSYRLFDEDLEISLSTRESPYFRDHMVALGITSMSAGSKTNPGGYACHPETLEQFEIDDDRSLTEICEMIRVKGLDPVIKDWSKEIHLNR